MSRVSARYRAAVSKKMNGVSHPTAYGGVGLLPPLVEDERLQAPHSVPRIGVSDSSVEAWLPRGSRPADGPPVSAHSAPLRASPAPTLETPAYGETLYARRKAQYPIVFWLGMVASVFVHWGVFRSAPTFTAEVIDYAATELTAVELPPQVDIPPPPNAIARPAMPVVSKAVVSEDITISLTTFESFTPAALPPPPAAAIAEEAWSDTPTFTPFTVAPVLKNPEEATRAILAHYPRMLRDAGIGGTALMWFYIDEKGKVLQTRVAKSSGYESLDEAASAVAEVLVFSPAYNRDMAAKVWVQIPIQFNVRTP